MCTTAHLPLCLGATCRHQYPIPRVVPLVCAVPPSQTSSVAVNNKICFLIRSRTIGTFQRCFEYLICSYFNFLVYMSRSYDVRLLVYTFNVMIYLCNKLNLHVLIFLTFTTRLGFRKGDRALNELLDRTNCVHRCRIIYLVHHFSCL